MSNFPITGRVVCGKPVRGTVGTIPALRGVFTTPRRYAGSPLTTGLVFHKNIIRSMDVPIAVTQAEIERR